MYLFVCSIRIGDPTVIGWLTTIAYLVTAWLCLRALAKEWSSARQPIGRAVRSVARDLYDYSFDPPGPARRAGLWLILAVVLLALGLNKQLDFQATLAEWGRASVDFFGLYEERRLLQAGFILLVLAVSSSAFIALLIFLRGELAHFRVALGGLLILLAFTVIRAASFHHVDEILGVPVMGLRVSSILELSGIGLVALAAGLRIARRD